MSIQRYYFALTNLCNRACELCSCHSDPTRGTFLSLDQFIQILDQKVPYEAQLEGGEPTIHPEFLNMVDYLMNDPLCIKVILCTNAVKIPYVSNQQESICKIRDWYSLFDKKPFVLKPSINSHLINHSKVHMQKMVHILHAFQQHVWRPDSELIFNVRRIPQPLTSDGEQWIIDYLKELGLYDFCNDFEYQQYGKAEGESALKKPYVISNPVKFHLIAPDGKNFDTDLIARADYMKELK